MTKTSAFATAAERRRYILILAGTLIAGGLLTFLLLAYANPMPFGTEQFWLIGKRRLGIVIAMLIAALCQGAATVAFQTVVNNRIITPSIMGFESLYRLIHTATVFFFGAVGLINARTVEMFVLQLVLMVGLSLVLYTWLLGGNGNIHAMLLVGIVIGGGLGSLTAFMQRLLTPSEFDVLLTRMFASVTNADPEYFPIAVPLCLGGVLILWLLARRLNVLALGRDTTMNLGLNHKALSIGVLVVVSVLMATSTALLGPMTFFGFLVVTLTYQLAGTYDHRYLFPLSISLGFGVLSGSYFIMNHVFYAQGMVSIIIELLGGGFFLIVLLRKGRL